MTVKVKVDFDRRAALASLHAQANDALSILGQQALKDINKHVPVQGGDVEDGGGGDLRKSSISNSDRVANDLKYVLRWDEPYAQYLFHGEVMHGNPTERDYGPEKLNFTAALARMEWTKYAEKVYGKDWQAVFQAALRGGGQ